VKKFVLIVALFSSIYANYYYKDGKKVILESTKSRSTIDGVKLYRDSNSNEVGVNSTLIAKFKRDIDIPNILNEYNLTIKERIDDIYILEAQNPIESANRLYEANFTEYSHPNFLIKINTREIKDRYFNEYAYHLIDTPTLSNANINLGNSWLYSKGAGVKVAIFDSGIDIKHKDLVITSTYNTIDSSKNIISSEPHGTFIAGLIGARENSIGSIGVAPQSNLISIKMNTEYSLGEFWNFTSNLIKGFKYAKNQNIDIINCSWGTYNRQDGVVNAIKDLIANGRDGKGSVVIFSLGNAGCSENELCDEDYDGMPEGYLFQDESTIEGVLSIGATNHLKDRAFYSNYGEYLDFMAFGGDYTYPLFSTDISGSGGYDNFENLDYATSIGTSFSAPIVAGVSALILGVNPNLSSDDVKEILKLNSQKVGNYSYIDGKSYEMGYGVIDSEESVKFAYILNRLKNNTFNIGWYFWADREKAYLMSNPKNPSIWEFTNDRAWRPMHNASDFDGYNGKEKIFNNISISSDLKKIYFGSSNDNNQLSNRSFDIGWYFFATDFGTFIAAGRDSNMAIWEFTNDRKWRPIHNASAIDGYYHNAKSFFSSVKISTNGETITFK
jgi:subtilisin family serine protease